MLRSILQFIMSTLEAPQNISGGPETVETPPQVPDLHFDTFEDFDRYRDSFKEMVNKAVLVTARVTNTTSQMGNISYMPKLSEHNYFDLVEAPAIIIAINHNRIVYKSLNSECQDVVYASSPKRFGSEIPSAGSPAFCARLAIFLTVIAPSSSA